ncbi:hypothetical protein M9H77_34919 [Catharanthus roseus]|uniref:Uncharacterized protein n=1 Tax=Catharanthus roseus TaxID=4058 RepID=A0ACB9ZP91_CATRO|nr:hypothetical protein M9H77_34919 [Catharanthus roseus]
MGGQGTKRVSTERVLQNLVHEESNSPIVPVNVGEPEPLSIDAPIISSYNDRIRPLLDCVDKLRNLKVMQEGIQLPTIVVVGDQSSGKSSVLESLAGISLPRGQGICTRVPLIIRLQSHNNPREEMTLEFNGKMVSTNEHSIADAIILATDEIAGRSKGISNTPLTLTVKKIGVPDLTMVDLPGITRVPVHGQPEDIYEQISAIIMEYIKPEESIILNVLSATVDFSTCESIRMTLAVVTKPDKSPEGLFEKVTSDDVNIGLGYVVVRNRIGNESYEDARIEEEMLFESHPQLSIISKSMVGIPILAQKLVQIQATIISKCLPDIVRKINEKLNSNVSDLKKMPQNLESVAEAMRAFMHVLFSAKESSRKIFVRGEFDEFPDDKDKHCTARLAEMFSQYSAELQGKCIENEPKEEFLRHEIDILEESKVIGLPNFLPRSAFLIYMQRKVNSISSAPIEFLNKEWNYVEGVLVAILLEHSDNYPQIQSYMRRAASKLISKKKQQSVEWFKEIIKMEKLVDYTCHPEYVSTLNKLMIKQGEFMAIAGHLRNHLAVIVQQAFDMKMRMTSYWRIVLRRLVDSMALHILFSIQNLVNQEMESEIMNEIMGPHGAGLERMLQESPSVAEKRSRLNRSIKLLKESKEVVAKIMDRIAANGDF